MNIINLTAHAVNILDGDDNLIVSVPSTGEARLSMETGKVGEADGIPLHRTTFGKPVGLPEPTADTMYIVSALIRAAMPERTDIASPGDLVRDAAGRVVGCRHLIVN